MGPGLWLVGWGKQEGAKRALLMASSIGEQPGILAQDLLADLTPVD